MCTLHLFYQVFEEAPVLFVGNRDENLDRPWREPASLTEVPRIYGPRDLSAGGTWLGVNEAGVLVSLANRGGTLASGPSMCSRGTIVLETLRHGSAEEAKRFAEWVAPTCKAYTLLIADPERAFVVDHGSGGTFTYRLLPGCHVITNARFRDPDDAKASRSLRRMGEMVNRNRLPKAAEAFAFLADHDTDAPDVTPLCIHAPAFGRFGTSSASVIGVDHDRGLNHFYFAAGPPCSTPFTDLTPEGRSQLGLDDASKVEASDG
jgi:uncharacterized protein with NRDE domain